MSTVREKLKGAFDLTFFFGRGIKPFEAEGEGTRAAALRSMWIVAASYPLAVLSSRLYTPDGLEQQDASTVFVITTVQFVAGFILTALASWVFALAFGAKKRFWLFFQASNWTGIPSAIISFPVIVFAASGLVARTEMNRALVVVSLYFFFVGGCVAYRAFKVNWELAAFYATMILMINQQIWNFLFFLHGIPVKWGLE